MRAPLQSVELALLGPGAVGEALARELVRCGAHVRLWSRTPARASAARQRIARSGASGKVRSATTLASALAGSEAVLLCVADAAVEPLAARAAEALGVAAAPAVALHTNGFLGTEVLAPLAARGSATGMLHPLTPLPPLHGRGRGRERAGRTRTRARRASPFSDAWFAVGGAARARAFARRVVRALGGRELLLRDEPDASRRYHAAASLASGGLVALVDAALAPFEASAHDAEAARAALCDLLRRTLANVDELGTARALTGPASRGSYELVSRHLETLASYGASYGSGPDAPAELYRALLPRMLALAERRGSITEEDRRRVLGQARAR